MKTNRTQGKSRHEREHVIADDQIIVSAGSFLTSSGAKQFDGSSHNNFRQFLHSEAKTSMTSFEQANAPQFWTIKKGKRISEQASNEDLDTSCEPTSNFSAHYNMVKNKGTAKSKERRRINIEKVKKRSLIQSDLYFRGQVTSDEECTNNA